MYPYSFDDSGERLCLWADSGDREREYRPLGVEAIVSILLAYGRDESLDQFTDQEVQG